MDWEVTETGADLTLVWPGLEQSALLDHLAPVVDAGARGVAVDRDGPSVGAARVLAQHHPGGAEEEQVV